MRRRSAGPRPHEIVIDHQHDDRTDDRDKQAVEVEPADTLGAEQAEQKTADQRPDDTEHDIQKKAFAAPIDDLAADPAGDQAEDDPGKDGPGMYLPIRARFGPLCRKPARLPTPSRRSGAGRVLEEFLVEAGLGHSVYLFLL